MNGFSYLGFDMDQDSYQIKGKCSALNDTFHYREMSRELSDSHEKQP